jgi:flagellum-specific ATP synthase
MAELIRLGAYRRGSDPKVDEAITLYPHIETFLAQDKDDKTDIAESFKRLGDIVGVRDDA